MSNETHDQNQGMETPDTAPSRGRVIALALIMYVVVACAGYLFIYQFGSSVNISSPGEPTPTLIPNTAYPIAAYFTPDSGVLLTPAQIALANMRPAATVVELATVVGTYPEIKAIYLDPGILPIDDPAFLRQQLADGKIMVGLKIDHADMATLLDVPVAIENLSDEVKRDSLLWVSVFWRQDGELQERVIAFNQFEGLIQTIADYSTAGR